MIHTCNTCRAMFVGGCMFVDGLLGRDQDPKAAAKAHLASDRTTDCGAHKAFVTVAMREALSAEVAPLLRGAEWTEADGSQDYLGVCADWYGYEIEVGRHIDGGLWFGRWGPDETVGVYDHETAAECLTALAQAMHQWFRDGMMLMAERRTS